MSESATPANVGSNGGLGHDATEAELWAEIDRIHVENARLAKEAKRLQGLLDAVHQIAGELARPSGI